MPGVKVQRAESLRSERSDASLANKRVSFNNDVDVKHIQLGRHGNRLPTGTSSSSIQPITITITPPESLSCVQISRK